MGAFELKGVEKRGLRIYSTCCLADTSELLAIITFTVPSDGVGWTVDTDEAPFEASAWALTIGWPDLRLTCDQYSTCDLGDSALTSNLGAAVGGVAAFVGSTLASTFGAGVAVFGGSTLASTSGAAGGGVAAFGDSTFGAAGGGVAAFGGSTLASTFGAGVAVFGGSTLASTFEAGVAVFGGSTFGAMGFGCGGTGPNVVLGINRFKDYISYLFFILLFDTCGNLYLIMSRSISK